MESTKKQLFSYAQTWWNIGVPLSKPTSPSAKWWRSCGGSPMPWLKKVNGYPRGCYPVPWKQQCLVTSPPGGQQGSLSSYKECWPPHPLKSCSIQKGYSSRPWTDFSPWQDTNRGKLLHYVLQSGAGPIHIAIAKTFYFKSPLQILWLTCMLSAPILMSAFEVAKSRLAWPLNGRRPCFTLQNCFGDILTC